MRLKYFLLLLGTIFLIGIVSATTSNITCTPSASLSLSQNITSISCYNNGTSNVSIYPSPSYFYLSTYGLPQKTNTTITLHLGSPPDSVISGGVYLSPTNSLLTTVLINGTIPTQKNSGQCSLITLIGLGDVGYITGGTNGTLGPIEVYSPDCSNLQFTTGHLPKYISLESPTTSSMAGQTSNEYTFYLNYNVPNINLQDNQYQIGLSATGTKVGTTSIPFSFGISPYQNGNGNLSSNNLPVCSLNSARMELNTTYKLTCNNIPSGISIIPKIDSNYIIGLNNPTITSGVYTYNIKPIRLGATTISAEFDAGCSSYGCAPIGNPFIQSVVIIPAGLANGTSFNVEFTPTLSSLQGTKGPWNVTMQAIGPGNNLIPNVVYYLNAQVINNTFTIHPNVDYSLRATSPGYRDFVSSIDIIPKTISVSISPDNATSNIPINITINPKNANLTIDNKEVNATNGTFIGTLIAGNHTISATLNGYVPFNKTISILSLYQATTNSTLKSGTPFLVSLNRNATSIQVLYSSDPSTSSYTAFASGSGNSVSFTPSGSGYYEVMADGNIVNTYYLAPSGFAKFISTYWWIFVIGLFVIGLFVILFVRARNGGGYVPSYNTGETYSPAG